MRVLRKQEKRVPFKDLTPTLDLPDSATDSYDAERIHEERQLAELMRQLEQTQNVGSDDVFAIFDQQDNDLIRKFVAEIEVKWPDFDIPCSTNLALDVALDAGLVESLNTGPQPEIGFNGLVSSYVDETSTHVVPSECEIGFSSKQNLVGPSAELQLLNSQANSELNAIYQQNRQELLKEEEQQKQELIQQESAVERVAQMLPKSTETDIVSMNNLTPLSVSDQLISRGLDSMDLHIHQCNQENIIERPDDEMAVDAVHNRQSKKMMRRLRPTSPVNRSKDSLRKEKKARSSICVNSCNLSAEEVPNVPKKSEMYSCEVCDKQFDQKKRFTRHLRNHTVGKPFICVECGVAFSQKSGLTVHQRIHTGEKPFICVECGVAFNKKSGLTVHQRIHTGEKPFICVECGVAFSDKRNLVVHEKIHRGDQPYKCLICSAAFMRRHHLSDHLMTHTKEKPFVCDICNGSFRQKGHLSRHMHVHSGGKSFRCKVCKETFRHSCSLSRHRKVHTEEEE